MRKWEYPKEKMESSPNSLLSRSWVVVCKVVSVFTHKTSLWRAGRGLCFQIWHACAAHRKTSRTFLKALDSLETWTTFYQGKCKLINVKLCAQIKKKKLPLSPTLGWKLISLALSAPASCFLLILFLKRALNGEFQKHFNKGSIIKVSSWSGYSDSAGCFLIYNVYTLHHTQGCVMK